MRPVAVLIAGMMAAVLSMGADAPAKKPQPEQRPTSKPNISMPAPEPFRPAVAVPVNPPPPPTLADRHRDLVPTLVAALRDEDPVIRANAALSLQGLGVDAIPALLKLLNGNDPNERLLAVNLLGELGPRAEAALPTLLKILVNKSERRELREAASKSIALLTSGKLVNLPGR